MFEVKNSNKSISEKVKSTISIAIKDSLRFNPDHQLASIMNEVLFREKGTENR